jgi:uncharacterized membrane protein YbhN (UPF0104 family)
MIATAKRLASAAWARPAVRLAVQVGVSAALILMLLHVAGRADLAAALRRVRPGTVVLATALYAAGCSLNALRWERLLGYLGVREPLGRLNALYFIGNFCSLFLPTSAGGDAYRIYELSRRGRPPLRVLLATLQERLAGLGVTMCVGLGAVVLYRARMPASLVWGVLALQAAGVVGVAALLYPGPFLVLARRLWLSPLMPPALRRLPQTGPGARLVDFLRPLRDAAPMTARQVSPVLALALATFLLNALLYAAVGQSLGISLNLPAYCLLVALVWLVRMLPVSLNGIGLGEGMTVYVAGLFAVGADKALALGLTVLGLQTAVALAGGLLLLLQVAGAGRGARPVPSAATLPEEPLRRAA